MRGPRLKLIPASGQHLDHFAALNDDPEVMRHVTGRPTSRAETEAEWERRLGPRSAVHRGLGYWTGFLDSAFIGWWGIGYQESQANAGELGFRIRSQYWRQGLGIEGARLVVGYGFVESTLSRIWAGTVTANTASRATLSKLGMRCVDEPAPGVLTYEVTPERWLAQGR